MRCQNVSHTQEHIKLWIKKSTDKHRTNDTCMYHETECRVGNTKYRFQEIHSDYLAHLRELWRQVRPAVGLH